MSHEQFQSAIDSLNQCVVDCIHCQNACLEEHKMRDLVSCIRLDMVCADTCLFTAKMLASDSEFNYEFASLCAKVCDSCAEECEKHSSHMDHCKVCAESCRRCAEKCRSLARVHAM